MTDNELRHAGIVLHADGVAEERGGRPTVTIPRESLRRIELRRGAPGERLWLQTLFAAVMGVIGLVSAAMVIGELRASPAIHVNLAAGPLFLPVGALILWLALRPRHYLRITTAKEVRKLAVETTARPVEIASLLASAQRVHGHEVERDAPGGGRAFR